MSTELGCLIDGGIVLIVRPSVKESGGNIPLELRGHLDAYQRLFQSVRLCSEKALTLSPCFTHLSFIGHVLIATVSLVILKESSEARPVFHHMFLVARFSIAILP